MKHLEQVAEAQRSQYGAAALFEVLGGKAAKYKLCRAGTRCWVQTHHGVILDTQEADPSVYKDGKTFTPPNRLKKHTALVEAMRADIEAPAEKTGRLFSSLTETQKTAALTGAQSAKLDAAWRRLVAEWADIAAGEAVSTLTPSFSKGALAVHFVRSLIFGEELPRNAGLAYVPHRFYVRGSMQALNTLFEKAVSDPDALRGLRFAVGDDTRFDKVLNSSLPVHGHRMPADFPALLARDLINQLCPEGGRVFDPCHGWGGRLLGFMLSHASSYIGFDPAPGLGEAIKEMYEDLCEFVPNKKARFVKTPFEDADFRLDYYDFAFTSPPYFNIEQYNGKQSSWRRYKTLDAWVDGFYFELLRGVAEALKSGAYFALQVTPKFDLVKIAKQLAGEAGLVYEREYNTTMRRYNAVEEKVDFEPVVLFRRK